MGQEKALSEFAQAARDIGFQTAWSQPSSIRMLVVSSEDTQRLPGMLSALLEAVPIGLNLRFFDHFHPQFSDPGAYIHIVKKPEGFVAMKGNHGWSSRWQAITAREAVDAMVKNWDNADPSGAYLRNIVFDAHIGEMQHRIQRERNST